MARGLLVSHGALGVIYPLWGASALLILALDRYVIRTVRPLSVAFGQR